MSYLYKQLMTQKHPWRHSSTRVHIIKAETLELSKQFSGSSTYLRNLSLEFSRPSSLIFLELGICDSKSCRFHLPRSWEVCLPLESPEPHFGPSMFQLKESVVKKSQKWKGEDQLTGIKGIIRVFTLFLFLQNIRDRLHSLHGQEIRLFLAATKIT